MEVNDNHEGESQEHSKSVSDNKPLESKIAFLQLDSTSSLENVSPKSRDVSLSSENAALRPDNEFDYASPDSGPETFRF